MNPTASKVETERIRSSKTFSATKQLQGQHVVQETLSQKEKKNYIIRIRNVKFSKMINSRSFYQEDVRSDIVQLLKD